MRWNWRGGRMLGAAGVMALGLGGAAFAQGADTEERLRQDAREVERDARQGARDVERDARQGARDVEREVTPPRDGGGAGEVGRDIRDGAQEAGRDVRDGAEDVGEDLREGARDVEREVTPPRDGGGAGEVGRDIRDGAQEAGRDIRDGAEDVGEDLREGARDLEQELTPPRDGGGAGEDEGAEWINRPMETIEQEPTGESQESTQGLIGAEQLRTQQPGTGGSGPAMFGDATSVEVPRDGQGNLPDLTVAIDAGVDTFTGDLGGMMMPGVGYGIRVGGRFWEHVGVEVGYSGSRNGVQREWAPENGAAVHRHSLGLVVTGGRTFDSGLRPHAGLGFGGGRFIPNTYAQGDFQNDWFTEVPIVAGVDYQMGPVYAGLRGEWRFLMGEEFANPARDRDVNGSMLGLSLNLGGRF